MFKNFRHPIEKKDEGEYAVTGDLTIHGVTKTVAFAVEGPSCKAKPHGEIPASVSPQPPKSIVRISA
jgi:polyisoprenoid-binding protein YceI